MYDESQKSQGAYYTPSKVAKNITSWVVKSQRTRILDPGCGTGNFIIHHRRSVGVEADPTAAAIARERAPSALVHNGNFFRWAAETKERFDAVIGNPPFIRYQTFAGELRKSAKILCAHLGLHISGLASSWAPYVAASTRVLKRNGSIAFIVPAEIGHATYSRPLLKFLLSHFGYIHIICVKKKIFAELNEDCWVLHARGFGENTNLIHISKVEHFESFNQPPPANHKIHISELEEWSFRLRPFLLPAHAREAYEYISQLNSSRRLGELAKVGIGYVTGDNDFFHLRPSEAQYLGIPSAFLKPTVRKGSYLKKNTLDTEDVKQWLSDDLPVLLLHIKKTDSLPDRVWSYLSTESADRAKRRYKCRTRTPWYYVPDVHAPDGFLTYMSDRQPALVKNNASCVCTNSVHSIRLFDGYTFDDLTRTWHTATAALSCELEGHALGGGMLKIEPKEATRILLYDDTILENNLANAIKDGLAEIRSWRNATL